MIIHKEKQSKFLKMQWNIENIFVITPKFLQMNQISALNDSKGSNKTNLFGVWSYPIS